MNKKINLPLAALGFCWLLMFVGTAHTQKNTAANSKVSASQKHGAETILEKSASKAAPPVAQKSVSYTHATVMLRSIADAIKACPRTIEFDASKDSQEREGPLARSRLYHGPPVNVVWRVGRSNSIQSPHQGYVQFLVPREFWIPPDVQSRWASEAADLYATMLQVMPPLEYRYKFVLGPDGPQLNRMLFRAGDKSEWKDVPAHEKACSSSGCSSACWLSAVQPKQMLSGARKR